MTVGVQQPLAGAVQSLTEACAALSIAQRAPVQSGAQALETRLRAIMHSLRESQVYPGPGRGFDLHRRALTCPADPQEGINGLVGMIAITRKIACFVRLCGVPTAVGGLINSYLDPNNAVPCLLEQTESACFRLSSFLEAEPLLAAVIRETGALSVRTHACNWHLEGEEQRSFDALMARLPPPTSLRIRGSAEFRRNLHWLKNREHSAYRFLGNSHFTSRLEHLEIPFEFLLELDNQLKAVPNPLPKLTSMTIVFDGRYTWAKREWNGGHSWISRLRLDLPPTLRRLELVLKDSAFPVNDIAESIREAIGFRGLRWKNNGAYVWRHTQAGSIPEEWTREGWAPSEWIGAHCTQAGATGETWSIEVEFEPIEQATNPQPAAS